VTTFSIVLASSSRYRRELLSRLILDFQCQSPDVDESTFHSPDISPERLARILASAKAENVAESNLDSIVIGSDQLVDLDGKVLGKPGSTNAAIEQLQSMSGKTHRLITAVSVLSPNARFDLTHVTRLHMRAMSDAEIERYVDRDQPLDCAGSYKIESLGISLFDRIETSDFTSIMGLPLIPLSRHLRTLGIHVP
jgi:septum formation protein